MSQVKYNAIIISCVAFVLSLLCNSRAAPAAYEDSVNKSEDVDQFRNNFENVNNTTTNNNNNNSNNNTTLDGEHSQPEQRWAEASDSAFKISLLPEEKKTLESVNLEYEGLQSKVLSAYDNTHKKYAEVSHPVAILDTISEHEKYGNNGDMFDAISKSIVNGYEAFSNLLNTLIQKPKEFTRTISKGITAQLDIIGGKIVGL